MGQFKIEITAVGGHGQDRNKKEGENINFNEGGEFTPDALAKRFTEVLKFYGITIDDAKIIHWPGTETEVTDDLLKSVRKKGNF